MEEIFLKVYSLKIWQKNRFFQNSRLEYPLKGDTYVQQPYNLALTNVENLFNIQKKLNYLIFFKEYVTLSGIYYSLNQKKNLCTFRAAESKSGVEIFN